LTERLEKDRPWQDPELDLSQLAADMKWSENRLSQVINEDLGSSFYAVLAHYRLAEFERLAQDLDSKERSVLDLAMDAGFNSKASFYRAFRHRYGATTPTAFRQSAI
jgi:AraC-like DNA-binding protein